MIDIDLNKENEEFAHKLFELINWVGNGDNLAKTISEHIATAHRTLVQSVFRCVAKVISEYAKCEYYDDRNKGSLIWAKDVAKIPYSMPHY